MAYPEFDPTCAGRIDRFRAAREPERAKLVLPHVTLVFGVADAHLQTVTEMVDRAASRTQAFDICFEASTIAFDPFEKKHKIFLLCGEGGGAMTALHTRLYDGAHRADLSKAHRYRPDMTIGTFDARAEAEQVDISRVGTFPIRGKLRALVLVRLSDGGLATLRTAPLLE